MERRFILLFAFLLSVSLPGNAGAQDKVALQGKWRAVEATSNGKPSPAGLLEKAYGCLRWRNRFGYGGITNSLYD
jgi:hypothetical protein